MSKLFDTTICAPATGGGAISVIRVSGDEALEIVDRIFTPKKGTPLACAKGYTMHYGEIREKDGIVLDDVVVSVYRAPHSYTGENSAEISCHASRYIVSRILGLLIANGAKMASPGEFTQRAFINGKMDLSQAEAVADVIASSSQSAHRVAMTQLRGNYSDDLAKIRAELVKIASLIELELDFSEEEVEFADRAELLELAGAAAQQCRRKADSFHVGNALKNGVPVAIVGAPNSGKSTLLNTLVGDDRAIVSDIPGTTRDTIEDTCVIGGILFRFIDTAGIRVGTCDIIEKIGIERTYREIDRADIVLGVVDALSSDIDSEIEKIRSRVNPESRNLVIVLNKCDVKGAAFSSKDFPAEKITATSIPLDDSAHTESECCPDSPSKPEGMDFYLCRISALTGEGVDSLCKQLVSIVEKDMNRFLDNGPLVSSERHAVELRAAADDLDAVCQGIRQNLTGDLLAEDLRSAISHIGSITGEITSQEVLNEIFSKHCIGK